MARHTLFEILRFIENHSNKSKSDSSSYIDSIIEHLHNILNTRYGNVLIAEHYGMPDFTNFPDEKFDSVGPELEKIIKTTIERYEPRLSNIKVNYSPSDQGDRSILKFGLSAQLIDSHSDNKSSALSFEVIVNNSGIVKIEQ